MDALTIVPTRISGVYTEVDAEGRSKGDFWTYAGGVVGGQREPYLVRSKYDYGADRTFYIKSGGGSTVWKDPSPAETVQKLAERKYKQEEAQKEVRRKEELAARPPAIERTYYHPEDPKYVYTTAGGSLQFLPEADAKKLREREPDIYSLSGIPISRKAALKFEEPISAATTVIGSDVFSSIGLRETTKIGKIEVPTFQGEFKETEKPTEATEYLISKTKGFISRQTKKEREATLGGDFFSAVVSGASAYAGGFAVAGLGTLQAEQQYLETTGGIPFLQDPLIKFPLQTAPLIMNWNEVQKSIQKEFAQRPTAALGQATFFGSSIFAERIVTKGYLGYTKLRPSFISGKEVPLADITRPPRRGTTSEFLGIAEKERTFFHVGSIKPKGGQILVEPPKLEFVGGGRRSFLLGGKGIEAGLFFAPDEAITLFAPQQSVTRIIEFRGRAASPVPFGETLSGASKSLRLKVGRKAQVGQLTLGGRGLGGYPFPEFEAAFKPETVLFTRRKGVTIIPELERVVQIYEAQTSPFERQTMGKRAEILRGKVSTRAKSFFDMPEPFPEIKTTTVPSEILGIRRTAPITRGLTLLPRTSLVPTTRTRGLQLEPRRTPTVTNVYRDLIAPIRKTAIPTTRTARPVTRTSLFGISRSSTFFRGSSYTPRISALFRGSSFAPRSVTITATGSLLAPSNYKRRREGEPASKKKKKKKVTRPFQFTPTGRAAGLNIRGRLTKQEKRILGTTGLGSRPVGKKRRFRILGGAFKI